MRSSEVEVFDRSVVIFTLIFIGVFVLLFALGALLDVTDGGDGSGQTRAVIENGRLCIEHLDVWRIAEKTECLP